CKMENQTGRSQAACDQQRAIEAGQHILALLNRAIPQAPGEGQNLRVERPPSVESEMARSFRGFFKRASKNDTISISSVELEHLQAGLGKRTLSITSGLTHAELSCLLRTTYPKMLDLEDRWLIYKAAGGNGRRKMYPVPLEAEGYTGSLIRRASSGGKYLLYLMPLQDELDLTPLPADSPEFALMPKAACKKCKASMPLQMLALHIEKCSDLSRSDSEEADVMYIENTASSRASTNRAACSESPDQLHSQQVHYMLSIKKEVVF
ncbi:hypothetical protein CHARACLAT_031427, partial [Characodon lateralis]|nr:hypothetical protein [Characodon lateralis]